MSTQTFCLRESTLECSRKTTATPKKAKSARNTKPPKSAPRQRRKGNTALRGYRRNVGICLVNPAGLVFAARRCNDKSNSWQMPQGGIDRHENARDAAMRELQEETGITSARIVGTIDRWLAYDFPTTAKNKVTGGMSRFKGQAQRWMLMFFYGSEEEIDLQATRDQEFHEYKWMQLEELPSKVIHFKAEVYKAVSREFVPLIQQHRQSRSMEELWWSR